MTTPKYHKAIATLANKDTDAPHPALAQVHYAAGRATAGNQFRMVRAQCPKFEGIEGDRLRELAMLADDPAVPLVMMAYAPKYPDVDRLIENATEKEPLFSVSVNYHYLLDIVKALAPFTSSLQDVTIDYYGKGSPLVLKAGNKVTRTDAIALLMPLRM